MSQTLSKLLLIRKTNAHSTFLENNGLTGFAKGDYLMISPVSWTPEDGITHYGYSLSGLKLEDYQKLVGLVQTVEYLTLLDLKESVEDTLQKVGLRINPIA